jgi:hypothetical protein
LLWIIRYDKLDIWRQTKPPRETEMKHTKAKCERFAKEHNLTIELDRWAAWGTWSVSYSVDLPAGMITETGYCGQGGETDDAVMAEVWHAIWDIMDELTSVAWLPIEDENT